MLKQIDHIGINVSDMNESLKKYKELFNVEPKYIEDIEYLQVRMAMIPVGEVMVELVTPLKPGEGFLAEMIAKNGEGLSHIAYLVDDIKLALKNLKEAGVKLVHEEPQLGAGGSQIAFIDEGETNSVPVELVERKGGKH